MTNNTPDGPYFGNARTFLPCVLCTSEAHHTNLSLTHLQDILVFGKRPGTAENHGESRFSTPIRGNSHFSPIDGDHKSMYHNMPASIFKERMYVAGDTLSQVRVPSSHGAP